MRLALALSLVCVFGGACKKRRAHDLPPELEKLAAAYERAESRHVPVTDRDGTKSELPASTSFYADDDPVIAPTGLYVRKHKVSALADLTPTKVRELLAHAPSRPELQLQAGELAFYALHSIVIYPDVPGPIVRLVVEAAADLSWRQVWIGALEEDRIETACAADLTRAPNGRATSVDVEKDATFIGQAGSDHFFEVTRKEDGNLDEERIATAFKDLEAAQERRVAGSTASSVVEIGIAGELTRDQYIALLRATCASAGSLALVPVEKLSARPTLQDVEEK